MLLWKWFCRVCSLHEMIGFIRHLYVMYFSPVRSHCLSCLFPLVPFLFFIILLLRPCLAYTQHASWCISKRKLSLWTSKWEIVAKTGFLSVRSCWLTERWKQSKRTPQLINKILRWKSLCMYINTVLKVSSTFLVSWCKTNNF